MCWFEGELKECPHDLHIDTIYPVPKVAPENTIFNAKFRVRFPATRVEKQDNYDMGHVNLHACRIEFGWCTPQASDAEILVTHSPQHSAQLHDIISLNMSLSPGQWTGECIIFFFILKIYYLHFLVF